MTLHDATLGATASLVVCSNPAKICNRAKVAAHDAYGVFDRCMYSKFASSNSRLPSTAVALPIQRGTP